MYNSVPPSVLIHKNNKNNEFTKLQYTNEDSELVLTVGKKEFNHSDHQSIFLKPSDTWLKCFDKELEAFKESLAEYPVTFPPSYPFEESVSLAKSYMQTRCPAWCDRVLLSHTAKELIDEGESVAYDLMGRSTCMGDHKPVYLKAAILSNSGLNVQKTERKISSANDIIDSSTVTRYIYIKNFQNPVKIFRETTV